MGDSGAMFIGLAMAGATISAGGKLDHSTFGPRSTIALLAPLIVALAVVFIPVLDFLLAVIRRTKEGRHPFSADKQHLHHRMLAIGHTHRQAVLIFYYWAFVLAVRCGVAGLRQLGGRDRAVLGAGRGRPGVLRRGPGCGPGGSRRRRQDEVRGGGAMTRPRDYAWQDDEPATRSPAAGRPDRAGQGGAEDRRPQPFRGHLVARAPQICWIALVAGAVVLGVVGGFTPGWVPCWGLCSAP